MHPKDLKLHSHLMRLLDQRDLQALYQARLHYIPKIHTILLDHLARLHHGNHKDLIQRKLLMHPVDLVDPQLLSSLLDLHQALLPNIHLAPLALSRLSPAMHHSIPPHHTLLIALWAHRSLVRLRDHIHQLLLILHLDH